MLKVPNEIKIEKVVCYYRVSTQRQGRSGLGLAAQKKAAMDLAQYNKAPIIAEYKEVESGTNCDRPVLAEALAHARSAGATLVVAKLDRLARNAAFTKILQESAVKFVCCDNPNANWLTIQILAAVAEDEARRTSERTKCALAVARQNGTKLGSNRPGHWEGREHLRGWKQAVKQAAKERSDRAKTQYAFLVPKIKEWREAGRTMGDIAKALNDNGHLTTAGKPFTETAVWRIIGRYIGKEYQTDVTRGEVPHAPRVQRRRQPATTEMLAIKAMRDKGMTFTEIATKLNAEDRRTQDGNKYTDASARYYYQQALAREPITA